MSSVNANSRVKQGHVFLSDEEKVRLRERAKEMGLSQSAYLRQLFINDIRGEKTA